MNKKMELLRETINNLIVLEPHDDMDLLNKSQEMDLLILQSIKRSNFVTIIMGDEHMNEFDIIIDKLQPFEKIYQSIRIVDPVRKKALELNESQLCETDVICHEFLKKEIICENCISIRAYNEDDTIFKMGHIGNEIYMVIAIPISIQEKKFVVELFKDVTNSLYLRDGKLLGHEVKMLSTIEHMNQAAVKDELTDLYNRRYINEKLPVDLLNSSLRNEPLSVIFADLDFFKTVNDKYGYIIGGQVLREFAKELKRHISISKDWLARYGGEEFMICLSNTDSDAATALAERIRKSVMKKKFNIGNERIQLTCSFGVHTVCNENEYLTIDEIIELADKKIYQAKAGGRYRVV
ncbi:GGDEF domain-containing protein [Clostridium estertheticum]|uniref:GGDEF domain-containing protein n=1 Tax=Clostridium estertheticum TaxID=238834 RepID=UPI0013E982C2|nr:GGDEF domain-containing protein [Clostridium estertheticum]MBZ9688531.1 GGDEF domain-containing protein [Clostridium estertheticum]